MLTIFLTLEDETGNVNIVVWLILVVLQREEVTSATLHDMYDIRQTRNSVRHLVANRLVNLPHLLSTCKQKAEIFTSIFRHH